MGELDVEDILLMAEQRLPALLEDEDGWNTLDIDYDDPRVERLWRPFDDGCRLYLHRIHPCVKALMHPHPWPSAIRVISGRYEMGVGYASREVAPRIAAKMVMTAGSMYSMTDIDGWHYVKPLEGPSLSLMISGKPWARWVPKADYTLHPLSDATKRELLGLFRQVY